MKNETRGIYWILCGIVIGAACAAGFWYAAFRLHRGADDCAVERDTVYVPHVVREPSAVESVYVDRIRVRFYPLDKVVHDTDSVVRVDTVTKEAVIPISQKVYKDSMYTAWVSGYRPRLDSIKVVNSVVTRDMVLKPRRWSVGVQGGVGMTPKGVQPYVGIGVSWRIWN